MILNTNIVIKKFRNDFKGRQDERGKMKRRIKVVVVRRKKQCQDMCDADAGGMRARK